MSDYTSSQGEENKLVLRNTTWLALSKETVSGEVARYLS